MPLLCGITLRGCPPLQRGTTIMTNTVLFESAIGLAELADIMHNPNQHGDILPSAFIANAIEAYEPPKAICEICAEGYRRGLLNEFEIVIEAMLVSLAGKATAYGIHMAFDRMGTVSE